MTARPANRGHNYIHAQTSKARALCNNGYKVALLLHVNIVSCC